MTRNPDDSDESSDTRSTRSAPAADETRSVTVVATHAPGSLGMCDACSQKSATHLLASDDALCGYCCGVRQGYIQRTADLDDARNKPPVDGTVVQQLDGIRLGPDQSAVRCHRCGTVIRAGSQLLALASRPAGEEMYGIDYVWCTRDWDMPIEFHEGVHELVVQGRHGTVTNPATGEESPVLLDPTVTKRSIAADAHETLSEAQKELRDEILEKCG